MSSSSALTDITTQRTLSLSCTE